MSQFHQLKKDYPWIQKPLIIGAPMRLIALAEMAVEISKAGGIGFIGAGTDVSELDSYLITAKSLLSSTSLPQSPLPIGVGFINWGADIEAAIPLIHQYRPAAVWFFAPTSISSLKQWVARTREASSETKIWVQVGGVEEAKDVVDGVKPDVLVIQGTDSGGHGRARGASLVTLVPEACDMLADLSYDDKYLGPVVVAAGGIADSRGAAAALVLGASGVVMGTRFLAANEACVAKGYQDLVLRTVDGGQTTARTKVYDQLRGTTGWAESHNARGILNKSYFDALSGMDEEENKRLYQEEIKKGDTGWAEGGRMTAYAGNAVGLVNRVQGSGEIVREVREGTALLLRRADALL